MMLIRSLAVALAIVWPLGSSLAQSAPPDDIIGLAPGMTFDAVSAVLGKAEGIERVETAPSWIRQNHGIPTRQLLRATNGVPCAAGERAKRPSGADRPCDTFGGRFQAVKNVTEDIIVAFAGMPQQEIAVSIWRRSVFPPDATPTVSNVEAALIEKYGKPHIRQTESGYYSLTHRFGTISLNWIYLPNGRRLTTPDSAKSRCVNGPRPWFGAKHTWNAGCGLTIRAEIVPVPDRRLLAQELNVTTVRQNDLMKALRQFETDLKAQVENQSGRQAKKPRL